MYLPCIFILCSLAVAADCPLSSLKDGEKVKLRGNIRHGAHDMMLSVPACGEDVVLVYAEEAEAGLSESQVGRNAGLQEFRRYASATYAGGEKSSCHGCYKYEVEAILAGRLCVAVIPEGFTKDALGFVHDGSGKVVGKAGFGHPLPLTRYQLVIESASGVVARELPRGKADQ